ncbi:sporulation protein [Nonomuraea sp. C10]|uniref:sporulation protein n=1 Tax=Nonomuraea sp. C10 TaxID=2600577 RepID=UPI0011CDB1E0|nr:sporulation protein [Nonomuraea sp. C10]TXK34529.1 sporulation protein [Nonomuraea sp. C10]
MVFKRMLGAFGVGAPSVDTVLSTPRVRPGGALAGEVRLKGGEFDAGIEHVTLALVARAEAEAGDDEHTGLAVLHEIRVSGPFTLAKGEDRTIPFEAEMPWETPLSEVQGQPLTGMALGVRTELAIAKAVDKGDLDPIAVEPLPSQQRVMEAFLQLGFAFKSADLEMGQIYGVRQELPCYQEIEFYGPPGQISEAELTFVADPVGMDIVIEADRRSGHYGSDAIGRFRVSHDEALRMDWAAELGNWLGGLSQHQGFGHGEGHYQDHHGHHGHHDHHHGGGGMGGAIAAGAVGVAAGVAGGMIAAELIEEAFEGDEEEGED